MTDIVERLRAFADRERPYGQLPDALDEAAAEIERQAAELRSLRAALRVLKIGLNGLVDSEDAAEIANAIAAGEAIDWDRYPPATRAALEGKG